MTRQNTASCIAQTFPAPAYTTTPIAAPLRGRIGLAVRSGENIYGPLDAGCVRCTWGAVAARLQGIGRERACTHPLFVTASARYTRCSFSLGFACTNGLGSCASGTDITMCA